jgi:hypothetical protein
MFILAAFSLLTLSAHADKLDGFYAGAALDFIDSNAKDAEDNPVDFRAIEFTGGYKYNGWVGGELRVGLGFSGESFASEGDDTISEINVEIDHFESLYYRIEAANATAKLYGLIGYSNIQMSSTLGDISESASESGASYGAGVSFAIYENANLNFEYRQLINTGDSEFTVINLGFDYRF